MIIKSIRKAKKIAGKKIFLRSDFNLPAIKKGAINDINDSKIVASLPTIRFLLRYKCRIIIATHFGHPNHKKDNRYSVKLIASKLEKLLGKKVDFIDNCIGFKVGTRVANMKNGDILLLENLRFHKEEEMNNKKFAKNLAVLADIYVNDAFAVSHRNHASVSAIKSFLPSFAGFLLENEIKNLSKVLKPKDPFTLVVGGAKIQTKIPMIRKFCRSKESKNKILIGGVLANIFLAANGLKIGNSLVDKKSIFFAHKIKNKNIILPIDVVVGKNKNGKGIASVKSINKIEKDDIILDIGPKTIKLYARFIKKASTIIWNGPMGMFEFDSFKYGTLSIARVIAARSTGRAFGVVGGGETVKALKMTKMFEYVDWVSTGGGAMLTFLGGGNMPGLRGIIK